MSMGKRISLFVLTVFLTSIITMGLLSNSQIKKHFTQKINGEMQNISTSEAEKIDALLEKEISELHGLAYSSDVATLLLGQTDYTEKVSKVFDAYVKDVGNSEHVFLVDKNGTIVADSDRKLIGNSVQDRKYTLDTLSSKKACNK